MLVKLTQRIKATLTRSAILISWILIPRLTNTRSEFEHLSTVHTVTTLFSTSFWKMKKQTTFLLCLKVYINSHPSTKTDSSCLLYSLTLSRQTKEKLFLPCFILWKRFYYTTSTLLTIQNYGKQANSSKKKGALNKWIKKSFVWMLFWESSVKRIWLYCWYIVVTVS